MDWILQMPLRLGLSEYWLARRSFARARAEAEELSRLAATSGERTYLALGRRTLAEAASGVRDEATAQRELLEALRTLDRHELPLAAWKVCATAARSEEARGQRARADDYWARTADVLDRLGASFGEEVALRRSFLAAPAVQGV